MGYASLNDTTSKRRRLCWPHANGARIFAYLEAAHGQLDTMLLVPTQMEQSRTAHRVALLGAAVVVTPDLATLFPKLLLQTMGDKKLKVAAQAAAYAVWVAWEIRLLCGHHRL